VDRRIAGCLARERCSLASGFADRYGMKERAADAAALAAAFAERPSFGIAELGKRRVVARERKRRIMKFVAAQARAFGAKRAVGQKPCRAITEMQFALSEAGRMAK
jgi:hypothetical protein